MEKNHTPSQLLGFAAGIFTKVLRHAGDDGVFMYRIPALTTTRSGALIAAFDIRYHSDKDLPGEIDIGFMRSTDGGNTWSPMRTLMGFPKDEPGAMGNGVGDPAILADLVTGTLWVAGLWSKGDKVWATSGPGFSPEDCGQFLLSRSDDDGVTWSAPINITRQAKKEHWTMAMQGPGRGIQLREGTLVFPAQYGEGKNHHSFFIYSEDHGLSWKRGTTPIPGGEPPSDECQLVERADGSLLMSINSRDARKERVWAIYHRNAATGKLDGGTWSDIWYALPDPGCMGSIVAPPDGQWILASNAASKIKREKLTVYLSTDGGKTWPVSRLLADGGWCAYSCMTILPDGSIGILHEHSIAPVIRDPNFTEIRWTVGETTLAFSRFTLDWLAGK